MEQTVITVAGQYSVLKKWAWEHHVRNLLIVCGKSVMKQEIYHYFGEMSRQLDINLFYFMDFQPNPLYENVVRGIEVFRRENCDSIIAIGGGSSIDVAKCIKLYSNSGLSGEGGNFLDYPGVSNPVPFLAIPTTAGSGSEATRFSVIYYNGIKQSICDADCIPGTVLFDSSLLKTLPLYQKKATMMDALCHAIESFWSVNSTDDSREYSREAINRIMRSWKGYLSNTEDGRTEMLSASYTAGRAINIAQTTAGHAMCYKITELFGCAHGHAAALCDRVLFPWMCANTQRCIDQRGQAFVNNVLDQIGTAIGGADAKTGAEIFDSLFDSIGLTVPAASLHQFQILRTSVNPERLKNHPIMLDEELLDSLYHAILRERIYES